MKEVVLKQPSFIREGKSIQKNSIKIKIFLLHILILLMLFIFFCSTSVFLLKVTATNTLESYGKSILKNYKNTFDMDSYIEFLENPSMNNPQYEKLLFSMKKFKKMVNAVFIYTIKLDDKNQEVMLIDGSEGELFLPPGYILRDKATNIVRETYRKRKFVRAQYINNSWGEYYSFYYPILDSNKNVISLLGMDLDIKPLNKIVLEEKKKILGLIFRFPFLLYAFSLIITSVSMSRLMTPLRTIKSFLEAISNGNLSQKFTYSNNKDEFSSIQNLFIDMINWVKQILKTIIFTSKKIESTFSEVEMKKTDIISKIVDINSLTSNISKSNEKIFLNTNNVKNEIVSFNSSINKMSTELFNTKELSKSAHKICVENTENIQSFILEISPLIQKFENFKQNTTLLSDLSSEIKQILKEIHEIANQTKLLSLNASIVAASAGEHGDGFAVVSREIGELSYKTSQSVSHIQDTLATIIKTISFINSETVATSNIFKEHALKSSLFSRNLNKINSLISKTTNSLEKISSKSTDLIEKNSVILKSIKYIHDESKSNNSTLKSISNSTHKLSELSSYFKIEFQKINRYIKNIRNSYTVFRIRKDEEQV